MKYPLLFFLIFTACGERQPNKIAINKELSAEVLGTYKVCGWGSCTELTLGADGKFRHELDLISCLGSGSVRVVTGTYERLDDNVILKPAKYLEKYYEYEKPSEIKVLWDSVREMSTLRDFYDSLVILPWNGKLFLLGTNVATVRNPTDFLVAGISPFLNWIIEGDSSNFQSHFLSKKCKPCTGNDLQELLPERWKNYLATNEIKANVVRIDSIKHELWKGYFEVYPLITIDAGKNQGVHRGYNFYSDGGAPQSIRIVEVNDSFSKGVSFLGKAKDCKIGLTMSTRRTEWN